MAGEVFAFSESFDHGFDIQHDLKLIYGRQIALGMFTDSKQLFDVIAKSSHTTEKRLMIEITTAREAYDTDEISNVGLIPGDKNPADGLTKPGYCKSLQELLEQGHDGLKSHNGYIS